MHDEDRSAAIQESVKQAIEQRISLNIIGGGSKSFYGRSPQGKQLTISGHCGIIDYQPSELVITARAGTPLRVIQQALTEQGQMLAFEPPCFGDTATLGGMIACGLSGSRRPFSGSVRDFMLGCRIIDGRGDILTFGGQVMKNVAGYDVSRLMAGSLGTLGILLQASLKVLPMPQWESTCIFTLDRAQALHMMQKLAGRCLPLSGLSYDGERLYVRLSGAKPAVQSAVKQIGGDLKIDAGQNYWRQLNEQQLSFFRNEKNLWRLLVPPATDQLPIEGESYLDWGGALRWLFSTESATKIFAVAAAVDGHASLFKGEERNGQVFQPLLGPLRQLQRRVKAVFDPHGIFNSQRMYQDW